MAIRAKQKLTSLPFQILVTELCQRAGVLRYTTRDVEVIPSSAIDIRLTEAEFTLEEVDRKRISPTDTSPEVNVDSLPAEASSSTAASEPLGTSTPSSSSQVPGVSSSSQSARITQAMILKMGRLAQSADTRAAQLERSIPRMIESAILDAFTPLQTSVDALTVRVTNGESKQMKSSEVSALKAEVADLRKDVDYLKSTDFTSLLEAADDVDTLETSKIPPATTRYVHRDGTTIDELEAETDEEQIKMREESIYEDFQDLEETIVQTVIHTSLTETSTEAPK